MNELALSDKSITTGAVLFPIGTFQTDKYGTTAIPLEMAQEVVDNHNSGVLGIKPMVDEGHKFGSAYGWVMDNSARVGSFTDDDGNVIPAVLGDIEWTEPGVEAVKGKIYRYLSAALGPVTNAATGAKNMVLRAVSLTNTPVMRMMPEVALADTGGSYIMSETDFAEKAEWDVEVAWSDLVLSEEEEGLMAKVATMFSDIKKMLAPKEDSHADTGDEDTNHGEIQRGGTHMDTLKLEDGTEVTTAEVEAMRRSHSELAEAKTKVSKENRAGIEKVLGEKGVGEAAIQILLSVADAKDGTLMLSEDGKDTEYDIVAGLRKFADELTVVPIEVPRTEQQRPAQDETPEATRKFAETHGVDAKALAAQKLLDAGTFKTFSEAYASVTKEEV